MRAFSILAPVSLVALAVSLSACGGANGGGVATTPLPTPSPSPSPSPTPSPSPAPAPAPSPTPTPTYQTLSELDGDQTFATAGVTYRITSGALENGASYDLSGGPKIQYQESTDTFAVTVPGQAAAVFAAGDIKVQEENRVTFDNGNAVLTLWSPTINHIPLSYLQYGSFYAQTGSTSQAPQVYLMVGGVPTIGSDMPTKGTANYSILAEGRVRYDGTSTNLIGGSTNGTLTVDFGSNSLSLDMHLLTTGFDYGQASGVASLTAGNPTFLGTLSNGYGVGEFGGSFFGPQAEEVGFSWFISGTDFYAVGLAGGRKD